MMEHIKSSSCPLSSVHGCSVSMRRIIRPIFSHETINFQLNERVFLLSFSHQLPDEEKSTNILLKIMRHTTNNSMEPLDEIFGEISHKPLRSLILYPYGFY